MTKKKSQAEPRIFSIGLIGEEFTDYPMERQGDRWVVVKEGGDDVWLRSSEPVAEGHSIPCDDEPA